MIKIEKETASLNYVTTFITLNGEKVLVSEPFIEIDQDTLISLLQLKYLNASEFVFVRALGGSISSSCVKVQAGSPRTGRYCSERFAAT